MRSFVDSTALLPDADALRERAESDGYLFFKALLPRDEVRSVRADLLSVVARHGWRAPQAPDGFVDEAVIAQVPAEEMRLDIGVSNAIYNDVQRLESVHRLPHHPRLLELFRAIFGSEVLVHPRHIVRMITAHPSMVPTPHHQDFPLVQGTPRFWTCWFPIGDCPLEMGGLAVLRGSHRRGYLPIEPARGAGGLGVQLCPGEEQWLSTNYQAGDVLCFPAYTVHKGLPNQRREMIRLSFDVRYQSVDEPIETRSLRPHCELSWEEIYRDWQRDDLQFYWEKRAPEIAPWDDALVQPSRRIC